MKQTLLIFIVMCLLFVPMVFAGGLGFSDITVEVEGEDDDDVSAAGGSFEVTPGNQVEITIEVESTFSTSIEGHDIENIEVSLDGDNFCARGLDTGVDEEIRLDDLSPGNDDSATFRFYVPECAEEDTYDFEIVVEGKDDDDGTPYSISETIVVHVEKNPSDVTLDISAPTPEILSCDDRTFTITAEVHNLGSMDENAGLLLINDDLGINTFRYLDLRTGKWTEEDTSFFETFSFTVDDGVLPGDYQLRAEVEYDKNRREIKRYQTITVAVCEEGTGAEEAMVSEEETEDTVTVTIVPVDNQEAESTSLENQKETMLFSAPFLIAAIIVAFVLLSILLYLMKKKIL